MKRKTKILIINAIILDFLICCFLFILYGPWSWFRNFWITTSMTTMNHKYLAHWFYSEKTIERVLADNYVLETGENTDTDLIDDDISNDAIYSDKYEEQILKKDKNNDNYKIINIKGNGYRGYMAVIYDSSKIELVTSEYFGTRGQTLDTIVENNNAIVGMNASGFIDPEGKGNGGAPTGIVIKDGRLAYGSSKTTESIIGFDKYHHLVLVKDNAANAISKYNIKDAVSFGPFLIVNGKAATTKGNGGWGIAPRTVIAQRKDGIVLLLVIDGRQPGYSDGATMNDLIEIMTNYKAINAANLDGGASTALLANNKVINKTCSIGTKGLRALPDAWIVKK